MISAWIHRFARAARPYGLAKPLASYATSISLNASRTASPLIAASVAIAILGAGCGGSGVTVAGRNSDEALRAARGALPTSDAFADDVLRFLREEQVARQVMADAVCAGLEDGLDDVSDWEEVLRELIESQLGSLSKSYDLRSKAEALDQLAADIRTRIAAGEQISVRDALSQVACVVS